MITLSIQDVPEAWVEALKQRAARNHRSLHGELIAILEAAVDGSSGPQRTADGSATRLATDRVLLGRRRGHKTIEQIAEEHRKRFPEPIRGGSLAVDIIRADRDSR